MAMTIEGAAASRLVAGHRGFKAAYPENTLLSFREALKLGVPMLEFDLRLTKDDTLVVLHDETVDRTTDGSGPVSGFTFEALRQLDAGSWFAPAFEGERIPSLAQLCELLRGYPDVLLNVEIKSNPRAKETADRAIAMLNAFGLLPRCVFTCFDAAVLAYLHDAHGVKTQGFEGKAMSNFDPDERQGTYSKMWAIAFPMKALTAKKVQAFQRKGLHTWCYCPNTQEQVAHAAACGATLLTCDDPRPALAWTKN